MLIRYTSQDELTHHGIKGQKWGVRRYQNPDGSLTDAGYFDMPLKGSRYGITPYNDSVGGVVEDVITHEDKWWAIPSAYFYMDNNK